MSKLLWPLLVVNLKILGLIWRGKAYFGQNNTTIGLPDHTRQQTTSEEPCRTPTVHVWRQLTAWRHKISYFSLFTTWYGFWNCKSLLCIFNAMRKAEKRGLSAFPDLLTWRSLDVRTLKFFPPAECWLVNPNFPPASRMQGGGYSLIWAI